MQGIVTKQENNVFKNKIKTTINKAKHSYYKNVFDSSFGNMKLTWKILNNLMGRTNKKNIKSLIGDSGEIFDEFVMAETFNKYFASVPIDLDSKVPHTDLDPTSFIHIDLNSIFSEFYPCTPIEVSSTLNDLKTSRVDINSVPNKIVIEHRDIFSGIFVM